MNVRRIKQITTFHRINQLSTNITELNAKFFSSSRPEVFCKDIFFCKIHRKTLLLESLFNKVVGQELATLKKDLSTGFSSGFAKFLRTPFLWSHITLVLTMYHMITKSYIYMPAGSYIKENC